MNLVFDGNGCSRLFGMVFCVFLLSGCIGWQYGSVTDVSQRQKHLGFAVAVCQAQSARLEQKMSHAYVLERRAWQYVSMQKTAGDAWISAYEQGIALGKQLSYRQAQVECESRLTGLLP